jgi:hypothetical protein
MSRSLRHIVRHVLLLEADDPTRQKIPQGQSERRILAEKIALRLYMARLLRRKLAGNIALAEQIDFSGVEPRVKGEFSQINSQIQRAYDKLVSMWGSPTIEEGLSIVANPVALKTVKKEFLALTKHAVAPKAWPKSAMSFYSQDPTGEYTYDEPLFKDIVALLMGEERPKESATVSLVTPKSTRTKKKRGSPVEKETARVSVTRSEIQKVRGKAPELFELIQLFQKAGDIYPDFDAVINEIIALIIELADLLSNEQDPYSDFASPIDEGSYVGDDLFDDDEESGTDTTAPQVDLSVDKDKKVDQTVEDDEDDEDDIFSRIFDALEDLERSYVLNQDPEAGPKFEEIKTAAEELRDAVSLKYAR